MKNIRAYWWSNVSNFGDKITPYLVEKITGRKPTQTSFSSLTLPTLFAAGSILQLANRQSVIWGSGLIEYLSKNISVKSIHAVRGPLTRDCLLKYNIPCPEIYGDPGILLPRFYNPAIIKKHLVGIIPHYVDKDNRVLEQHKEWLIIDVQKSVEEVIDSILSCEIILSSSLHGLIVADAYNIPSSWIKLSNNKIYGNDFKFHDYYASVDTLPIPEYSIHRGIKKAKKHGNDLNDNLLKVYPNEFK